jgi:hypothetical protein
MIQPETLDLPVDQLPGESVVTLYFADQKPVAGPAAVLDWRLDGQLTRMLLEGAIHGRAGEHVVLQGNGKFAADWALFVGGGKWEGLSAETHAALVRHMLSVADQAGFTRISLSLISHDEFDLEVIRNQVAEVLAQEGQRLKSCFLSCDVALSV